MRDKKRDTQKVSLTVILRYDLTLLSFDKAMSELDQFSMRRDGQQIHLKIAFENS